MRDQRNIADAAESAEPDVLVDLRAKYLDLSRKYAALVRRLEVRTSELVQQRSGGGSAVYRLGFWALNVTASGLALVKDGAITTRNARWHELDVTRGGWMREDKVPSTSWIDLSQAAVAEARQLPERAPAVVLRRYRRMQEGEQGPGDLGDVRRQAIEVLHLRRPPGAAPVEVRTDLPDLPLVLGSGAELSHLFVTLLFNARDAMPDGGMVHVRAERARDRVRVTVADGGTGIAPEHLPRLFQPFFTTKGAAGTGLGLWLAQSTMRRIGGTITARNRRVGGAEFLVELQVAGDGHRVTPRARARTPRPERNARR